MLFFFPPDMARPVSLVGDSSEHAVAGIDSHAGSNGHAASGGREATAAGPAAAGGTSSGRLLASLVAIAGCSGLGYFLGLSNGADARPTAAQPLAAPAPPAPDPVLVGELESLNSLVDGLKEQLRALQGRVDSLPRPDPAPDLKPIQSKVDALSNSLAALGALPGRLSKLGDTVTDLAGKGAALEKAGKPAAADIETTFADLP
jgi:hypothetical protein